MLPPHIFIFQLKRNRCFFSYIFNATHIQFQYTNTNIEIRFEAMYNLQLNASKTNHGKKKRKSTKRTNAIRDAFKIISFGSTRKKATKRPENKKNKIRFVKDAYDLRFFFIINERKKTESEEQEAEIEKKKNFLFNLVLLLKNALCVSRLSELFWMKLRLVNSE